MRKLLLALAVTVVAVPAVPAQTFLRKTKSDWLKDLASNQLDAQRSAAFALGKLRDGSDQTLTALTVALENPRDTVRDAAAFALGEIASRHPMAVWQKSGEELRKRLHDSDKRVRRSAAFALGSCGEQAQPALADLTRVLREDDAPVVRRNAAWALGRVGKETHDRAAVDGLVAALKRDGEDPLVLRDVAGALGEIGRPQAAPAARPLAEVMRSSRDPAVRKTALNTLVNLVDPSLAKEDEKENEVLVKVLCEALREGDAESKGLVAGALANLGEHAGPAVKDLAALVDDDTVPAEARRNAVLALTKIPKAILALSDGDAREVVRKLARALEPGQTAEERGPTAEARARDEMRQFTAEALHRIGFPLAEGALKQLIRAIRNDRDPMVRHRAIWVFLNADNLDGLEGAKEVLLEVVKKKREMPLIRYEAARALARAFGAQAPDAVIATLEEMLRDTSVRVYRQTNADVKGGSESSGGQSKPREDVDGDGRCLAAHALSFIGPRAKRGHPNIVPLLKELAKSKDPMSQQYARLALEKIGE
ncbi:MAG: HEAT repeat domain-containing protein [Planctomycetes bacterium]|nr:HEAT repeat domain-containing protein [Planctomycetota bacterium]